MNKWSRRGLITAGVIGGSALIVGVAIRPGNRNTKVEAFFPDEEDELITSWVKVDPNNVVTAIVPHAEMGQGTHSTLAQMLAEEMDIPWSHVRVEEAPAHEEYANYPLGKGFLLGDSQIPSILMGTLDGAFFQLSKLVDLQITGGSTSIRLTGNYGTRVAGAAAREMLIETAAEQWEVDSETLEIRDGLVIDSTGTKLAPIYEFAAGAGKLTPTGETKTKGIGRVQAHWSIHAKTRHSTQGGRLCDLLHRCRSSRHAVRRNQTRARIRCDGGDSR